MMKQKKKKKRKRRVVRKGVGRLVVVG